MQNYRHIICSRQCIVLVYRFHGYLSVNGVRLKITGNLHGGGSHLLYSLYLGDFQLVLFRVFCKGPRELRVVRRFRDSTVRSTNYRSLVSYLGGIRGHVNRHYRSKYANRATSPVLRRNRSLLGKLCHEVISPYVKRTRFFVIGGFLRIFHIIVSRYTTLVS